MHQRRVEPLNKGIKFDGLIADKAFDANWIIAELNHRGAKIVISQKVNRTCQPDHRLRPSGGFGAVWQHRLHVGGPCGRPFRAELCRAIEDGRAVNERWHLRRDGSRFWASGLMMPLLDAQGQPNGFLNILTDRTVARAETERRELQMAEMNHRIKNSFAGVLAVAAQTGRHPATITDFTAALASRLRVLSRSHDMLIRGDWVDAPLRAVIEGALVAYQGDPERVALDGAAVMLAAPLVVAMSLVFHELATNAAKYGALSVPTGRVDVGWTVIPGRPGGQRVEIVWRERGGPPVRQPTSRGFGSQLLDRGIPAGGTVRLDYLPAGLECRIVLPLGSDARP